MGLAAMVALGLASPVFAGETKDILQGICKQRLNMTSAACACIGGKAEAELSANEQKFVITMLSQDKAAMGAAMGQFTQEEMRKAGEFMTTAPKAAEGGLSQRVCGCYEIIGIEV